jgi:copper(I)-binding protein
MHGFAFQKFYKASFTFLGFFACLTSCPLSADITVKNAWIRPSTGPNAALFITLVNTSSSPEKLTDVRLEGCHHAELHTHEETNGISRMIQVKAIDIPALGEKELKPGEHHVMLMKLHKPLTEGDSIPVLLTFETGKTVELIAPVKMEKADCCGVSILQKE